MGLTQEECARAIDVTLGAWKAWEGGINQPRWEQLIRIAGLTESPALRIKFWLDISDIGIRMLPPTRRMMTQREALFVRYVNDIVMAARELCVAAAEGSTASEELLRHAADSLIRAAGDIAVMRERREKQKDVK